MRNWWVWAILVVVLSGCSDSGNRPYALSPSTPLDGGVASGTPNALPAVVPPEVEVSSNSSFLVEPGDSQWLRLVFNGTTRFRYAYTDASDGLGFFLMKAGDWPRFDAPCGAVDHEHWTMAGHTSASFFYWPEFPAGKYDFFVTSRQAPVEVQMYNGPYEYAAVPSIPGNVSYHLRPEQVEVTESGPSPYEGSFFLELEGAQRSFLHAEWLISTLAQAGEVSVATTLNAAEECVSQRFTYPVTNPGLPALRTYTLALDATIGEPDVLSWSGHFEATAAESGGYGSLLEYFQFGDPGVVTAAAQPA